MPKVLTKPLDFGETDASPRPHRVRLLGVNPGFLSDPVGLDQDDYDPANPGALAATTAAELDSGPDWISIAIGNDNPYLETRGRGDPGGVGYYRLSTQVQVIDSPTSNCTVGFQAFTPAGWQYSGVQYGPTSVCPNIGWFQLLNPQGTALQPSPATACPWIIGSMARCRQNLQYGLAVQHPVWLRPATASARPTSSSKPWAVTAISCSCPPNRPRLPCGNFCPASPRAAATTSGCPAAWFCPSAPAGTFSPGICRSAARFSSRTDFPTVPGPGRAPGRRPPPHRRGRPKLLQERLGREIALREVGQNQPPYLSFLGQPRRPGRGHVEVVVGLLPLAVEIGRFAYQQVGVAGQRDRSDARPGIHQQGERLPRTMLADLLQPHRPPRDLDRSMQLRAGWPAP